jgi:hypothetical protein
MPLANQIIVVPSSKADLLGTGLEATGFDWDRVETIELSSRAYVYPTATDQNLASVQAAQISSDLIILQGIKSFKLVGVEPQINTADGSGYKTVTGELPYEYEVMFDNNGVNLWKALRKLNSKDSYNIALYDVEGNKIFTSNKAGDVFKGFQAKMLFTGQYKGKEGNNPAEVKMNIQLADSGEMERQVWISGDTLDFDAKSDLDGVNDLYISNVAPPAVTGTSWTIGATLADRSQFVSGIAATQLFVKKTITGNFPTYTACTLTSIDAIAKTYTLGVTGITAGATYQIVTGSALGTLSATNIIQNSTTKLLYKGIGEVVTR